MATLMPLTLLLNKANGQKKIEKEKLNNPTEFKITLGTVAKFQPDTIESIQSLMHTIYGNIKDESGKALPFTTVSIVNSDIQTMTDEQGKFSLKILHLNPDTKLSVSNVSYEQLEVAIDLNDSMNIILKEKQVVLPEVCVKSLDTYLSGRLGGLVSVVRVVRKDSVKTKIRKIFSSNPFKVYPNPVNRGNEIHIEVKNEGHYSIQLLNTDSKLIANSLFDAIKGATTTSLAIPSSTAAGIYFIRLINDDTKQQYTDKIIIQ